VLRPNSQIPFTGKRPVHIFAQEVQELFDVSKGEIETELTLYRYDVKLCFWVLKAGPFQIIVGGNPGGFRAWLGPEDGYSDRQGLRVSGLDRGGFFVKGGEN
jgi:hypothetical protein